MIKEDTEYYETLGKAIRIMPVVINKLQDKIGDLFEKLPGTIEKLEDSIRSMNEDDFKTALIEIKEPRLIEKVISVRKGEKVNWFR